MSADSKGDKPGSNALAALRRFARPRTVQERCELCDTGLADDHAHLVELASRRLVCACDACAILFASQGAGKYRRVPRRVRYLPDFRLSDADWRSLQLPIDLAFFQHSTPAGHVIALYPSPAGATESLLPLDAWQMLTEDNPILRHLQPDVEALLVNRVAETRECYLAGIDECYKLVGLLRTHWRGLSGGAAVWDEIRRFFITLKERSAPSRGVDHA